MAAYPGVFTKNTKKSDLARACLAALQKYDNRWRNLIPERCTYKYKLWVAIIKRVEYRMKDFEMLNRIHNKTQYSTQLIRERNYEVAAEKPKEITYVEVTERRHDLATDFLTMRNNKSEDGN